MEIGEYYNVSKEMKNVLLKILISNSKSINNQYDALEELITISKEQFIFDLMNQISMTNPHNNKNEDFVRIKIDELLEKSQLIKSRDVYEKNSWEIVADAVCQFIDSQTSDDVIFTVATFNDNTNVIFSCNKFNITLDDKKNLCTVTCDKETNFIKAFNEIERITREKSNELLFTNIIFVSDGCHDSTNGGEPMEYLRNTSFIQSFNFIMHAIYVDTLFSDENAKHDMRVVAEIGKGNYFDISDTDQLLNSLSFINATLDMENVENGENMVIN